jgi:hypothetical protein
MPPKKSPLDSPKAFGQRLKRLKVQALTGAAPTPPKASVVINASAKEESDRGFHLVRLGSEIWATITDTSLFIGGGPSSGWVVPQWRPYIGIDAGGYSGSSTCQRMRTHPSGYSRGTLGSSLFINSLPLSALTISIFTRTTISVTCRKPPICSSSNRLALRSK